MLIYRIEHIKNRLGPFSNEDDANYFNISAATCEDLDLNEEVRNLIELNLKPVKFGFDNIYSILKCCYNRRKRCKMPDNYVIGVYDDVPIFYNLHDKQVVFIAKNHVKDFNILNLCKEYEANQNII